MELWIFGMGCLATGLGVGFWGGIRFNWRQVREMQQHGLAQTDREIAISNGKTERMQLYRQREQEQAPQMNRRDRNRVHRIVNGNYEAEHATE